MSLTSTKPPKPFPQVLLEIGYGALTDELTEEMQRCMEAVSEPGQKATLVLKLEFSSKKSGQILVKDDVTVKLPKKAREEHIMFQTADLHLTSRDPRQMELDGVRAVHSTKSDGGVRSVDVQMPTGDVKQVAGDGDTVRKVG